MSSSSDRSLKQILLWFLLGMALVSTYLFVCSKGLKPDTPYCTKLKVASSTTTNSSRTSGTELDNFVQDYNALSPSYNKSIGMDNPFVFFHQRKAGGSSMRSFLSQAAKKAGLTPAGVVGFGVDWETYHTSQASDPNTANVVYGGHLYYPPFLKTLYLHHTPDKATPQVHPQNQQPDFQCFTEFREPVSRVQSCWNYRMVQEGRANGKNIPVLTTFTASQMDSVLTDAMSQYGEGCLNEPMRVFSDFGQDEFVVNQLHLQPSHITDIAINQTVSRLSHCIVGILERCEDTKRALELHLPFLAPYVDCGTHLNKGRVEKHDLNSNQTNAIKQLTLHEQKVYQIANQLLDAQLQMPPSSVSYKRP